MVGYRIKYMLLILFGTQTCEVKNEELTKMLAIRWRRR